MKTELEPPNLAKVLPRLVRTSIGNAGALAPISMYPSGLIRIRSTQTLESIGVVVIWRYVPCAVSVKVCAALNITWPMPPPYRVAP